MSKNNWQVVYSQISVTFSLIATVCVSVSTIDFNKSVCKLHFLQLLTVQSYISPLLTDHIDYKVIFLPHGAELLLTTEPYREKSVYHNVTKRSK